MTTLLPPPDHRAFATAQLDRLMGFFPRVDGKASAILAIDVAMLGVLGACFPISDMGSLPGIFGIIAAVLILVSLWKIYGVFFPHLKAGPKPSLLFFGDIAARDWATYHGAVTTLTEEDLLEDLTCQIWRNAEILKVKFTRMEEAFMTSLASLPFWVAPLLTASIAEGKIALPG